jgi:hypothetical protein
LYVGVEEPEGGSHLYGLDHAIPSRPIEAVQSLEDAEEQASLDGGESDLAAVLLRIPELLGFGEEFAVCTSSRFPVSVLLNSVPGGVLDRNRRGSSAD